MIESKWRERLTLVGLFALAGIFLAVFTFSEPVREGAAETLGWFEEQGKWGPLLYVGMYAFMVLLMVPAIFFTLGAGFVFGFWMGFVVVLAAMAISSPIAFLLARYTFGENVARKLKRHPRLKMLNQGLKREGWKIVLLSRLVPGFPFKLSNYFFGLTEISLRGFFFGGMIGVIPLTVVNVYIGSLAGKVGDLMDREVEPWEWVFYGVGLVAAIVLLLYLIRLARARIRTAVAEENSREAEANT